MLHTLLESNGATPRRVGGTMVSVALHVSAIALAIVASAGAAAPGAPPARPEGPIVIWTPPSPRERGLGGSPRSPDHTGVIVPTERVIAPDIRVPNQQPAIDFNRLPTHADDFNGDGAGLTSEGVFGRGGSLASPTDGVYTPTLVDKAAAPQPDNPAPVYPPALRSAQIEGTVLATFVVDTLGRAEPATIRFSEATHPQFADAVRQSLLRSRYLPAIVRGRPVRQLVEQRFAFTLTR